MNQRLFCHFHHVLPLQGKVSTMLLKNILMFDFFETRRQGTRLTLLLLLKQYLNPLEPNGHYSGRTAQLISKICI
jgi:hypothetical protein